MTVSINTVVEVQTSLQRQTPAPNQNTIAYFTTATPNNTDIFRVYTDASFVEQDYGSNSLPYKAMREMVRGSFNFKTGGGSVVIIPMLASVGATQGFFITANLSANIDNIKAVNDGDIRIPVDSTNYDLTELNFTNITGSSNVNESLIQIAAIIQERLQEAIVSVVGNTVKTTSNAVGASSLVSMVQLPSGTGTDLSVASLFNVSAGAGTAGADESGETLLQAYNRVKDLTEFYAIITDQEISDAGLIEIAPNMQAIKKRFYHHAIELEDMQDGGVCETINDLITNDPIRYTKFFGYASGTIEDAFLHKCRCVSFLHNMRWVSGINLIGVKNAQLNSLPDKYLTTLVNAKILGNGVDTYPSMSLNFNGRWNKSLVNDCEYSYYADTIELRLQYTVANVLYNYGRKIVQTEADMIIIKSAIESDLRIGVDLRIIGLGLTWNGATIGDDPKAHIDSIRRKGFYIYSQPVAEQSQASREAGESPIIQVAIKFAGGIEKVFIAVTNQL